MYTDPLNANLRNSLGSAFYLAARTDDALREYREVLRVGTAHKLVRKNLEGVMGNLQTNVAPRSSSHHQ